MVGAGLLVVILSALAAPAPSIAEIAPGDGQRAAIMGKQGLVDTLAGPGHCPQTGAVVAGSDHTRALTVDDDGRVFYETGSPDAPEIAVVDGEGHVGTLVSRIPQPPVPSGAPPAVRDTPPGGGRMVADGHGGVIVAAGTQIMHIDADSGRTTLAGDSASEPGDVGSQRAGDGGPAEEARFRSVTSLARDAAGNLYLADHGGVTLESAAVRFVNRSDEPVTFYPGTPEEITVEPGHIATIAGTLDLDDPADEATDPDEPADEMWAGEADFTGTTSVAVSDDRLYVASAVRERDTAAQVDMINLSGDEVAAHGRVVEPGRLQTVAGGDDPDTAVHSAAAIAADSEDLYIANPARHRVHHLDDEGFLATLAGVEGLGGDVGGFDGNRQAAAGARLNEPFDVAAHDGEVYIADQRNGQVRRVDDTGHIHGLPGASVALAWHCESGGDTDVDVPPQPGAPASVAVDARGAIYYALADGHLVKRRDPGGRTTTTVAGRTDDSCRLGCVGFTGDGGPATDAKLDTPTAVALSPDDDILYVYDGGNARVRAVNLAEAAVSVHGVALEPGTIDTVAGSGTPGSGGGDGPALEADLAEVANPGLIGHGERAAAGLPQLWQRNFGDLAVDSQGHLLIAEPRQHPEGGAFQPYAHRHDDVDPLKAQVREVDPDGQLSTVAGDGAAGSLSECCTDPAGLAVDADDNLYVSDTSRYQVWLVNRGDNPVNAHGETVEAGEAGVVAGTGESGFAGEGGEAADAELLSPAGLAVGEDDALHIVELDPRGGYVRTVTADGVLRLTAGSGQAGFNGDGLASPLSTLNLPTDIAADECGNLVVADAGNDRVRRINLAGECDPGADAAPAADTGGASPLTLALLASAAALVGVGAGWYWRQRRTAGWTRPR